MELDGAYVWVTRRKIQPGTREEFSRSWRPREFPEGMLRAYELVSPDGNEVIGVSYVLEEVSGFYLGRELRIPRD